MVQRVIYACRCYRRHTALPRCPRKNLVNLSSGSTLLWQAVIAALCVIRAVIARIS